MRPVPESENICAKFVGSRFLIFDLKFLEMMKMWKFGLWKKDSPLSRTRVRASGRFRCWVRSQSKDTIMNVYERQQLYNLAALCAREGTICAWWKVTRIHTTGIRRVERFRTRERSQKRDWIYYYACMHVQRFQYTTATVQKKYVNISISSVTRFRSLIFTHSNSYVKTHIHV